MSRTLSYYCFVLDSVHLPNDTISAWTGLLIIP
jgi:hypothetical protein